MERLKFEDSFQEAFKGAEVSPSENVWTNIELDLEKAEGGKMKRRLLFFKTLAAASVIFATCIGGIGYYFLHESSSGNIAQQTKSTPQAEEKSLREPVSGSEFETHTREEENEIHDENSHVQGSEQTTANKPLESSELNIEKTEQASVLTQRDTNKKLTEQANANLSTARKDDLNTKNTTDNKNYNERSTDSQEADPIHKNVTPLISNNRNPDHTNKVSTVEDAQKRASINTSSIDGKMHESNAITSPEKAIVEKNDASFVKRSPAIAEYHRTLPTFYQPKNPELQLPVSNADPGAILLAKLAAEEMKYAQEDKKQGKNKSEKLWTSVGFAAGGFSSINPSVNPAPASSSNMSSTANVANAANVAAKQSKASGVAYSVGFSVGTKLSNRWVLQGGFNYLTQSSDYTANNIVVDNNLQSPQAESLNFYSQVKADASSSQSRVAQTFPYTVNNNVQFVSLPVQAGYLVVNKKFGLQVNAGVSTDLFLQNKITPEGGGINTTTQGRGDDSPYRSLNFSGLMGTEFSYKLSYRYRVSLNPGLRYPLNSVYKSNTGVQATPLTFDVGLRFRYIFR